MDTDGFFHWTSEERMFIAWKQGSKWADKRKWQRTSGINKRKKDRPVLLIKMIEMRLFVSIKYCGDLVHSSGRPMKMFCLWERASDGTFLVYKATDPISKSLPFQRSFAHERILWILNHWMAVSRDCVPGQNKCTRALAIIRKEQSRK